MLIIVHLARLLKRSLRTGSALACVPRVASRLGDKRKKSSKKKRKAKTPKKRKAPTPKPPKKRKAPKKKRKAPKKKPPKKKRKRAVNATRSAAAKKGWEKRRKKQRLVKAMHDAQWRAETNAQPIGWTQRRAELREINGEIWREIAVEYSEDDYQARYLASLEDLEIDMLTKDELYDYLEWMAQEFDIDIGDLYRMYLGYKTKEEQ